MRCRYFVIFFIMWVSFWDMVCIFLFLVDFVVVWDSWWVVEVKGLKFSKEGGEDFDCMEAVTWGVGGCKNIFLNFSFCF